MSKVPRRSLEEAPNRSKDKDYFTKLIKKTDKEDGAAARVTTFSDQDFADILRSSLQGSKVPTVRVETADEGADTLVVVNRQLMGRREKGRGKERVRIISRLLMMTVALLKLLHLPLNLWR